MSLQRRLLLYLLVSAPLVWALALLVSVDRGRLEVNELFDAELVRLARQVGAAVAGPGALPPVTGPRAAQAGAADLDDLAVAVWDAGGRLLVTDREGAQLQFIAGASGFVDQGQGRDRWRVYYLQFPDGNRLVAAGQRTYERDELVFSLVASQLAPWLLVLPLLLVAMAVAVRRALAPARRLADVLRQRAADDLAPVPEREVPQEIAPLIAAMNGLFGRIASLLASERRFTADAAHELRTPLATLRAQWDVVRRAAPGEERARAEAKFEAGLSRMDRLVAQMLALSRADAADASLLTSDVRWPAVVEEVMAECLPLADRRGIELACEWPDAGTEALPLRGDPGLLVVMLRNLLDNAVRYAPAGSTVLLRVLSDRLEVENGGEALPAEVAQAPGRRFHRPAGQQETGSGLGLSIVQRIAALHGLALEFTAAADGRGVRAVLRRGGAASP